MERHSFTIKTITNPCHCAVVRCFFPSLVTQLCIHFHQLRLSKFSVSKNFYFASSQWNEREFTHCFKRAIKSNPRQWQSLRNAGWNNTESFHWSSLPSLTFHQLIQQGRHAGMHESWQRQQPGLQLCSLWNQSLKILRVIFHISAQWDEHKTRPGLRHCRGLRNNGTL